MGDADLKQDIARLVPTRAGPAALDGAPAPQPILGKTAIRSPRSSTTKSSGIASPLTENDAGTRTYYAEEIVVSSDGLFSFVVKRLNTINMSDANNQSVTLEFDHP